MGGDLRSVKMSPNGLRASLSRDPKGGRKPGNVLKLCGFLLHEGGRMRAFREPKGAVCRG